MSTTAHGHQGRLGRRAMIAMASIGLIGAACGIPTQESAEVLPDLPESLLAATTSTIAVAEDESRYELALFWHDGQGRLRRIVRPTSLEPTPQEAVDALLGGPTAEENAANPAELIALDPGLGDLELDPVVNAPVDGIMTIDVGDTDFRELDNKRNAAAELVCTLTQFTGVAGVLVSDSQPDPVVLVGSNSEAIEGPATRAHFGDCLTVEEGPSPETTTSASPTTD